MEFVPLWDSVLDNLKLHKIGPDLRGKWMMMLVAAQRHDRYEGSLPDPETLAFWLRLPVEEVRLWLKELTSAKMLDRTEDGWRIHDWPDWRCVKDKTGRERAKRSRSKAKDGLNEGIKTRPENTVQRSCNGDVTVPSRSDNALEENEHCSFDSLTHNGPAKMPALSVCNDDLEPFDPGPATAPMPPSLPPDKQRVLDRQIERWGASNGDRIVGDLLKDYSAEVVRAACDWHYAKNKGVLAPDRLAGICREMHAGRWELPKAGGNSRASPDYRPKPVAATPPPSSKHAPGPSISEDEAKSILFHRPSA